MTARPRATSPSRQITVSPVDSLAGIEAGPLAYTAGGPATPVTVAITASDLASTTLAGATIQISGNYRNGEDLLSFTNTANITGAWNATTGTLTLTGGDTAGRLPGGPAVGDLLRHQSQSQQRHADRELPGR